MKKGMKGILLCIAMIMAVMFAMAPARTVHAATVVDSGTIYGMSWRVTDAGVLYLGTGGRTETLNAGTSTKSYSTWNSFNQYWNSGSNRFNLKVNVVVVEGTVILKGDVSWMFANYQGSSMYLSGFDTTNVTSMDGMFRDMRNISDLDLSNFSTPNLTSCRQMFYGSYSLRSLDIRNMDLRNVSISGLTSMLYSRDGRSSSNWGLTKIVLGPYFVFGDPTSLYNPNSVYLDNAQGSNTSIKQIQKDGYTDSLYMYGWINRDRGLGAYSTFASSTGDYSINALARTYDESMAGTWEWGYASCDVYIEYDGGDGAVGSMPLQHVHKDVASYYDGNWGSIKLLNNTYVKPGYEFDHWEMETPYSGTRSLNEGITIYWPTYKVVNSGDETTDVRLLAKAVWKKRDTSVTMKDGAFTFDIKAGEKATFNDIPAGTSYQVYELTPDGWVLVQQENASGVIEALEESAAFFWNKYQPGVTTVQFSGLKTLDGHPASEGAYKFELFENGTVIDTATTQDGGFIQFKVIEYDAAGDHTYTIREVEPDDDGVDYDMHEETVMVSVIDDGAGNLSSEVIYDDDGIKFENHTRPGILRITKNADVTEANKDDTFTFEITFSNENGMPISDNIYWYVENGAEGSAE